MEPFSLDTPLITLPHPKGATSNWTIRHSLEGVQIFGGIGSGKTSGSGNMLALKYLKAGYGGLVLTAKPDEKKLWEDYCRKTSRLDDLLVVEPGGGQCFNFLDYESVQSGSGNALTENIVQVLKTVIKASEEKSGGGGDNAFWESALDMLIFNVIDLCQLAYGRVSMQDMFNIVQTLPKVGSSRNEAPAAKTAYDEAYTTARTNVTAKTEAWEAQLGTDKILAFKTKADYEAALFNAVPEQRLMLFIDQFFNETYLNLSEKTRSIIDFSFSGFLFRLLRDPVYSLFCSNPSTFIPEDCLRGKIILLNLPVKLYHKIGRDSQIMFKYIWQRAMEKKKDKERRLDLPLFLWADEAQNFLHEHDADYQATARSSRIATVYISQNLPNYHASMGGAKSEYRVKSFLGTLGTKIFHANADIETNKYGSDLIGDKYFDDISSTRTMAGIFSSSKTKNLKIDRAVRPEEFSILQTGGPANNFMVQGYWHQQGNSFPKNANHTIAGFSQNFIP